MAANPRRPEIIALRRAGVGPREIARRLAVSVGVVSGVLRQAGLSKPGVSRPRNDRAFVSEVLELREVHGLTFDEIAARLGITKSKAAGLCWRNGASRGRPK